MNDLLEKIYKAMDEKLAEDIVVIDFREQSPFVDYFMIATAKNARMAASIIDNIEEKAEEMGVEVRFNRNVKDSKWLLIDLGEIVCHIFYDNERQVYNLEGLWKDLPRIQM